MKRERRAVSFFGRFLARRIERVIAWMCRALLSGLLGAVLS
jgi:hypothetical protein